jgi:hypothetical protein
MEENPATTIASCSGRPQTGADGTVNTPLGPTESAAPASDPIPVASAEEPSLGPGAGASPGTSSIPASAISSTGTETIDSHSCAAKPVVRISGITEIGRDGKTSGITSWKPPFEVEKGFEASFQEIFQRAELVHAPMDAVPVPTGSTPYGTTEELFARLQKAIAVQACLSEWASRLLAYWTFSTWFPDALSLAPGLAIVGPGYEGDLVLCALRYFCRYPLMLTRADISSLKNVKWNTTPTLLFYDPYVKKHMISLLSCTATRDHLVSDGGYCRDFFGPKAYYLGDEASADRIPLCSLQVNVHPTAAAACAIVKASRLTEIEVQELQNELLNYRLRNLVRVYNSEFDASTLTSDTRAIANALGACVVDSPKLQSELISLLTPVENQRQADRSTGIEAVTLEATLALSRDGREHAYAHEIAAEANRLLEARGETARLRPENAGHQLKRIGLPTCRISQKGNGLIFDKATVARILELAAVYMVDVMEDMPADTENLHSF